MDKNAYKPNKEQIFLFFRGLAFCAKRNILYLCIKKRTKVKAKEVYYTKAYGKNQRKK